MKWNRNKISSINIKKGTKTDIKMTTNLRIFPSYGMSHVCSIASNCKCVYIMAYRLHIRWVLTPLVWFYSILSSSSHLMLNTEYQNLFIWKHWWMRNWRQNSGTYLIRLISQSFARKKYLLIASALFSKTFVCLTFR